MSQKQGEYSADERRTLAEAPGLRVRLLSLTSGQSVPWHYHNHITDTFICLRGPMRVTTREPEAEHVLQPGDTLAVEPGTQHQVIGLDEGPCKFIVIQGVGEYDYVAV